LISVDRLFGTPVDAAQPTFLGERNFSFLSPIVTPCPENNTVRGKLYRCGRNWRDRPAVILLHGWNGEWGYRYQFPWLAWRLGCAGINTAMIELPYHGGRKPRRAGAVRNFLSNDLEHTIEAARQALADVRALQVWLATQGCPSIGLWGFSLGAWLSGLLAAGESRTDFAVLLTPVARLDRAVAELPFCEPIRRRLNGTPFCFDSLNLISHQPPAREKILIIASQHDLFAPAETLEDLWSAWDEPEMWRLPHGHISVLMSVPILERTVKWIASKARVEPPEGGCLALARDHHRGVPWICT
jgi:dienelactone hydrolase